MSIKLSHVFLTFCALSILLNTGVYTDYVHKTPSGINAGTVIFGPSDAMKDCWSSDGVALLTSRLIIENMLPKLDSRHIHDDAFVTDIIEYFRLVLEVVRKLAAGKSRHILLTALTDAIGGYMKHLILPMAKYAYYAGNIDYGSVIKLYQLFDEIKSFLRTNGEGWNTPPASIGKHIKAKPIDMQTSPAPQSDPCVGLVYTKKMGSKKRSSDRKQCGLEIPMPFFDSRSHPASIAVPFRSYTLRNLESRASAYILVKYYLAAAKCLQWTHSDQSSVERFHSHLFGFLMGRVVPHLCDEKFYAGFGGVLRVVETIKQNAQKSNVMGSFNLMPEVEEKEKEPEEPLEGLGDSGGAAGGPGGDDSSEVQLSSSGVGDGRAPRDECSGDEDSIPPHVATRLSLLLSHLISGSKSSLLILAGLATIVVWFCLGAAFIWCKIKANKSSNGKIPDDKLKLLPCTNDTCPDKNPSASTKKSSTSKSNATPTTKKTSSGSSKTDKSSQKSQKSQKSKSTSKTSGLSNDEPCTNETCQEFANVSSGKSTENEDDGTSGHGGKSSSSKPTTNSNTSGQDSETSQRETIVHSVHYLPPSFACHTSMTGQFKTVPGQSAGEVSGADERTPKSLPKKPYVFGYDFQTSTDDDDSSQGTTDGEIDLAGNMSK